MVKLTYTLKQNCLGEAVINQSEKRARDGSVRLASKPRSLCRQGVKSILVDVDEYTLGCLEVEQQPFPSCNVSHDSQLSEILHLRTPRRSSDLI